MDVVTDDRVTLPLTKTRAAAELLHSKVCWIAADAHHEACLLPDLAERDLSMATTYAATSISGDCMDPVKHGACSGCSCHCHTLKTGRMRK